MSDRLRNIIQTAIGNDEYVVVTNNQIPRNGLAQFKKLHPGYISIQEYNIVGTPIDITLTLTNLGVSPENIQQLISQNSMGTNLMSNSEYALEKLRRYPIEFHPIKNDRITPLINRIQNLQSGQVLDVSNIHRDGSNVIVINAPGSRSKKIGSPDLPIVSDSFESYFKALHMLPGGIENYADDLEYVRNKFHPADDLFPDYVIREFYFGHGSVLPGTFVPSTTISKSPTTAQNFNMLPRSPTISNLNTIPTIPNSNLNMIPRPTITTPTLNMIPRPIITTPNLSTVPTITNPTLNLSMIPRPIITTPTLNIPRYGNYNRYLL